jgi:DNA-binding MarR family transcriptional regulator
MLDARVTRALWRRLQVLKRHLVDSPAGGLPALAALELTVPQAIVIFRLVEVGPQSIMHLCKVAGRSQAATSHLVAQLEQRGFVERTTDQGDARRTLAHATSAARELVEQVEGFRVRALQAALQKVPARTIRKFDGALRELLTAMDPS